MAAALILSSLLRSPSFETCAEQNHGQFVFFTVAKIPVGRGHARPGFNDAKKIKKTSGVAGWVLRQKIKVSIYTGYA